MNHRLIFNLIGKVLVAEAILLLFPLLTALAYAEPCALDLGLTSLGAAAVGALLVLLVRPKSQLMYAKEGLVVTAFSWIILSLVGAIPFVTSKEIPSFIDALFEIVSGFTTTGASILDGNAVETLSHGLQFWRSFSHWIGGMGVLVFVLVFANRNDRSIHILRAEMPGPSVDKLVPKTKTMALILYSIYIALTFILTIMLWCGGMSFYESLIHAFGTAGTGGFGIRSDSLASYSAYSQWVIGIFMLIFSLNFNLFYLLLVGKISTVLRNAELWVFVGTVITTVAIVTVNIYNTYQSVSVALRHSTFQVASVISTTGYSTVDFNQWPALSKALLFTLMLIGGCAGSTAGGFKLTRVIILFKKIGNNLKRVLHPRTTTVVKIDGKKLNEETIDGVTSYLAIYLVIFMAIFLLLSIDGLSFETNISAASACFNNIGPGFDAVGPMGSYAVYSPFSKVVLIFAMLLGRLEIYPMLLSFSPKNWIK